MPPYLILSLVFLAQGTPATGRSSGLALLSSVAERYAQAKSYHIEAIKEQTTSGNLLRSWQKTYMTAIVAPDAKYRYEAHSGTGSAIQVSNGAYHWDYHVDEQLYTRTPAQAEPDRHSISEEEFAVVEARRLVSQIGATAVHLRSASLLPDQTVTIDGRGIDCYVVRFTQDDMRSASSPDAKIAQTIWIDKARQVIVKTEIRSNVFTVLPSGAHLPRVLESTTVYPVVELGGTQPESAFTFRPPADAKLVESFPEGRPHVVTKESANFVGKPAPDVYLHGPDGKTITLSSFRGKPVFLEFWATWCAPCTELVPELKKLHAETAPKGLVWVGIDSDQAWETVAKYVATEHVSWPDYYDGDGAIGEAFGKQAIPLGVLVDSDGTVKFYDVGFDIAELRAAIANLGPEFASVRTLTAR
jgi:thiol-disulfide isomerase/thioredoxin/outer membrane lipoprotein-sorting protein